MYLHLREEYWPRVNREQKCLHKGCPDCKGTGRKANGEMCPHWISCKCKKCSPVNMSTKEWVGHNRPLMTLQCN